MQSVPHYIQVAAANAGMSGEVNEVALATDQGVGAGCSIDFVAAAAAEDRVNAVGEVVARATADAAVMGMKNPVVCAAGDQRIRTDAAIIGKVADKISLTTADDGIRGIGDDIGIAAGNDAQIGILDVVLIAAADHRVIGRGHNGGITKNINGVAVAAGNGIRHAATGDAVGGGSADQVGGTQRGRFQAQRSNIANLEIERLIIRGADKIQTVRRVAIAARVPKIIDCLAAQRRRIHVCQSGTIAGETVGGIAQRHRIAVGATDARRVDRPGINGIRRGRDRLALGQGGERVRAIGAHADLQPVAGAIEHAAKIQGHSEEAVGDAGGGIGQSAIRRAAGGSAVNPKAQIVAAGGGIDTVIEPALVGERRALGVGGSKWVRQGGKDEQAQDGKKIPHKGFCLIRLVRLTRSFFQKRVVCQK